MKKTGELSFDGFIHQKLVQHNFISCAALGARGRTRDMVNRNPHSDCGKCHQGALPDTLRRFREREEKLPWGQRCSRQDLKDKEPI